MRRQVLVTVSAMLMATHLGGALSAAEPNLQQLEVIAELLTEKDVTGLRDYLEAHPELTEGDTYLARLLREFMAESEDLATLLGFQPDLSDGVTAAQRSTSLDDDRDGGVDGPGGEPAY
jgi:hypothetical protein